MPTPKTELRCRLGCPPGTCGHPLDLYWVRGNATGKVQEKERLLAALKNIEPPMGEKQTDGFRYAIGRVKNLIIGE